MVVGIVIGVFFGVWLLAYAFPRRHEPAPPNNPLKLPLGLLSFALCVVFVVKGVDSWLFIPLGVLAAGSAVPVLSGRNPWWTQAPADRWRVWRSRR
jgi:hypothetical protein